MGEDPGKAEERLGQEPTETRGRAYRVPGITVYFDARKCVHSGVCVRGLPEVFDVKRRPWIRADLADPATVAAQIDRCPSGALSYDLHETDAAAAEGGGAPMPRIEDA